MNRRDIVIGAIVLAILAGVVFVRQRNRGSEEEISVPQTLSVEDNIEDKFNLEIPDDVDKAEMNDVSGGNASAISTRKEENGVFTQSILADLPDPDEGKFYQGWAVRGEEGSDDYAIVSLGKLVIAKGGWSLNFSGATDYSDYSNILVSLEENFDNTPEKTVLEGSF